MKRGGINQSQSVVEGQHTPPATNSGVCRVRLDVVIVVRLSSVNCGRLGGTKRSNTGRSYPQCHILCTTTKSALHAALVSNDFLQTLF